MLCAGWLSQAGCEHRPPSGGEPTQHHAPRWPVLVHEEGLRQMPQEDQGPPEPPSPLTAWKPRSSSSVLSSTTVGPFSPQWKASATSHLPVPSGSKGLSSPKNRRSVASAGKRVRQHLGVSVGSPPGPQAGRVRDRGLTFQHLLKLSQQGLLVDCCTGGAGGPRGPRRPWGAREASLRGGRSKVRVLVGATATPALGSDPGAHRLLVPAPAPSLRGPIIWPPDKVQPCHVGI